VSLEPKPGPKKRDRSGEGNVFLALGPKLKAKVQRTAEKEGLPISFWAQQAFIRYFKAQGILAKEGFSDVRSLVTAYHNLMKGGE
jgi:hypothetical protein